MDLTVVVSGTGFIGTDGNTYTTLAALKTAGVAAFPGKENEGLYPMNIVLTSIASGGGSGSGFEFSENAQTAPTHGQRVHSGIEFSLRGIDRVGTLMVQSLYVLNKDVSSDSIQVTAFYG